MLGLGLLGLEDMGPGFVRWWGISLLWATVGGVAIGALLGTGAGRLVVLLRSRHGQAVGLDEFLGLGLIGMAYGLAQISLASGFLAVFAAGLALQRVRERPQAPATVPDEPRHAEDMQDTVQAFNEQLEKVAELALVLMLGAMLSYARPPASVWWFVPLLLLVFRPLSVLASVPGEGLSRPQRNMIAWFGIRGIGSLFYLLFALRHGIEPRIAETLVALTLWTVATSIVVHGFTAHPLMERYMLWRRRGHQPR
jgi:sodium/hydrogen antiporter